MVAEAVLDGLILFGQVCKTATVRMTGRSYSEDNSPTIKLMTKKEEMEERARERLLAGLSERKLGENESILLICERKVVSFYSVAWHM